MREEAWTAHFFTPALASFIINWGVGGGLTFPRTAKRHVREDKAPALPLSARPYRICAGSSATTLAHLASLGQGVC
jgi:hypothetical protein